MENKNTNKKSNNKVLAIVAVILCVSVVGIYMFQRNKEADSLDQTPVTTSKAVTEKAKKEDTQVIKKGEKLVIAVSDISSTARFYPIEVDGTEMEVLAVTDSEGNIRTAFNTCQICYGSGHGYYEQEGSELVCQNCGNRFTVDEVEVQSGGCNPWPIFSENKTVTEDTIEISYDFLKESKEIFSNWKTE